MAKKSLKERLNELKSRTAGARAKARSMFGAAKPLLFAGGSGGAAFYGVRFLEDKVDFVKDNWWGRGAAIGLAALLINKKNHTIALGLAGAAGYAAAEGYESDPSNNKARLTPQRTAQMTNTRGYDDDTTGLLEAPASPIESPSELSHAYG